MTLVDRFLDDAQQLFNAAESASTQGSPGSGMTVLIGMDRNIRLVADSDWPLDSLMSLHGARTGYRISENSGGLRVDGREGARKCTFEAARPTQIARFLLSPR